MLDYSRNLVDDRIMKALVKLAESRKVPEMTKDMFSGAKINTTEGRAVLHTALRSSESECSQLKESGTTDVHNVLRKMKSKSQGIIDGSIVGCTGEKFTDVVNIGIGGSDLGPVMVTEALKHLQIGPNVHFVSNIDPIHLNTVLKKVNRKTTLFIVASKTFTTIETMTNAKAARSWFMEDADRTEECVSKHFWALSTNTKEATKFGILEENMFGFWDWVGGRYSLWSAIGLSIACSIGFDNFEKLLSGAKMVDEHFKTANLDQNIPVIMALLGVWYINFHDFGSQVILPYCQSLHRFPAYLQQLDMESNGKFVTKDGNRVSYHTGPDVWGEPGTNSQHSFFQQLHQGTRVKPADFIAVVQTHAPLTAKTKSGKDYQQVLLLSNYVAQTTALMYGKTQGEAEAELKADGKTDEVIKKVGPHKVFEGNRPTNCIVMDQLSAYNVGALIALYEHKIFVQGVIWGINSFDQFGVELGKQLATRIQPLFDESEIDATNDPDRSKDLVKKLSALF